MSRLLWVAAWVPVVVWDPEVAAWGLVGVAATEPLSPAIQFYPYIEEAWRALGLPDREIGTDTIIVTIRGVRS
jgi:hypothetical protein